MMNLGVATSAKGKQILQGIVAQLFGGCRAGAINVMHVKIFGGSTVLASEVVAFQGFLPIAAKVVVVTCFAQVLREFWIVCERLPDLLVASLPGAVWAVLLRARAVNKISAAICALKRAANLHGSPFSAEALQVQDVLLPPVGGTALGAALLHRASGLVQHLANDALAFLESTAGLSVGSQGTRLASLEIGGCLRNLRSAVGAVEDPVFAPLHNLSFALSLP